MSKACHWNCSVFTQWWHWLFHPMLAATWNVKVTRCFKGIHWEEDVTLGINLETIFIVTTLLFCMHILLSRWLLCCWVLSFLLEVVISCCCLYKHKGTPKGNSVVTQPRFYFFFFSFSTQAIKNESCKWCFVWCTLLSDIGDSSSTAVHWMTVLLAENVQLVFNNFLFPDNYTWSYRTPFFPSYCLKSHILQ